MKEVARQKPLRPLEKDASTAAKRFKREMDVILGRVSHDASFFSVFFFFSLLIHKTSAKGSAKKREPGS